MSSQPELVLLTCTVRITRLLLDILHKSSASGNVVILQSLTTWNLLLIAYRLYCLLLISYLVLPILIIKNDINKFLSLWVA